MKNVLTTSIIIFVFASCGESVVKRMPIDSEATPETVALYHRLFDLMEKGIMLGHQDDPLYGHGWYGIEGGSDVKTITGDYPAVMGFELGHIEHDVPYSLDSVYFEQIKGMSVNIMQEEEFLPLVGMRIISQQEIPHGIASRIQLFALFF